MKLKLRISRSGLMGLLLILTALLAASPAQGLRFVVLADSPQLLDKWPQQGGKLTPKAAINKECLEYLRDKILALSPKPDMVFFLGDLVTRAYYKDENGTDHRFIPDWKDIMRLLPQNGIRIYVAVGNRDLYDDKGWPPRKALEDEFRDFFSDDPDFAMPDNGPQSYKRLAYSFTYDNAFFVVLDNFGFKPDGANWDNGLDAEQLDWFRDQGLNSDAKFKFVLAHGPAFSPEGWPVDPSMKSMWEIMDQLKFSAYFCGHEHIFSRWIIDREVASDIVRPMIQTLTGSAGAYPDDPSSIRNKDLIKQANIWSGYNYVVVDVNQGQAVQRAYAVTKDTGIYKSRLLDSCTLK